jgi:hypothetical protein
MPAHRLTADDLAFESFLSAIALDSLKSDRRNVKYADETMLSDNLLFECVTKLSTAADSAV